MPQNMDGTAVETSDLKLIPILAQGTRALCVRDRTESEVTIQDYVYHPHLQAWTYRVELRPGLVEFVRHEHIFGIPDVSQKAWFDPQNLQIGLNLEGVAMSD